jgi:hypothetical protein
MSESLIKSHITIEEAKEQGLTQVAEQLRLNELTRKSLGLRTLQEEIKNPTKIKAGRPRISPKLDDTRKLIRVNTHNLT